MPKPLFTTCPCHSCFNRTTSRRLSPMPSILYHPFWCSCHLFRPDDNRPINSCHRLYKSLPAIYLSPLHLNPAGLILSGGEEVHQLCTILLSGHNAAINYPTKSIRDNSLSEVLPTRTRHDFIKLPDARTTLLLSAIRSYWNPKKPSRQRRPSRRSFKTSEPNGIFQQTQDPWPDHLKSRHLFSALHVSTTSALWQLSKTSLSRHQKTSSIQ